MRRRREAEKIMLRERGRAANDLLEEANTTSKMAGSEETTYNDTAPPR